MTDKAQRRASYLIRFGYIGSHFHGVQPNPGVATAGGELYELLHRAAGILPKALQFSARTDSGVHALENYASCWFPRPFDDVSFDRNLRSLVNTLLAVEATLVPYWVHARGSARGKWYRYVIEDGDPVCESNDFVWRVHPSLNERAMQEAANHLVGTHAFDAFRHGGCSQGSSTKTLTRVEVTRVGSQIHVDLDGTAFLRRMVRIIVGTLAEVGVGFRHPDDMREILESKQRALAGPSAPASGLTLMRVVMDLGRSRSTHSQE